MVKHPIVLWLTRPVPAPVSVQEKLCSQRLMIYLIISWVLTAPLSHWMYAPIYTFFTAMDNKTNEKLRWGSQERSDRICKIKGLVVTDLLSMHLHVLKTQFKLTLSVGGTATTIRRLRLDWWRKSLLAGQTLMAPLQTPIRLKLGKHFFFFFFLLDKKYNQFQSFLILHPLNPLLCNAIIKWCSDRKAGKTALKYQLWHHELCTSSDQLTSYGLTLITSWTEFELLLWNWI